MKSERFNKINNYYFYHYISSFVSVTKYSLLLLLVSTQPYKRTQTKVKREDER